MADPLPHPDLSGLFSRGPLYAGHEGMVPEIGDYRALERFGESRALVRAPGGIGLLSNVCRHRQAIMLRGSGALPSGHIVCPIHRWTYSDRGELVGAPQFPDNPCLHLRRFPLRSWRGLLFFGETDPLSDLGSSRLGSSLGFSGLRFSASETLPRPGPWDSLLASRLLRSRSESDAIEAGPRWEAHAFGLSSWRLGEPSSFLRAFLYPGLIAEWRPGSLLVSSIAPSGPGDCLETLEIYAPEEALLFDPEAASASAAFARSAWESLPARAPEDHPALEGFRSFLRGQGLPRP